MANTFFDKFFRPFTVLDSNDVVDILGGLSPLIYKGAIDLSSNPNYPSATTGDTYTISVDGKIGGASGVSLTQGDLIVAKADNAGGTQAAVGSSWNTIQVAINNIVVGPTGTTSSAIALYDGATGVLLKDSGVLISTDGTLVSNSDLKVATEKAVKTYIDTALALKSDKYLTLNTQTDSYTLALSDVDKIVEINKATVTTLTVPKNSVVAFPIGTTIAIKQQGAGAVTISPVDGDVTINSTYGLILQAQYSYAVLIKVDTNIWNVVGSLRNS